MPALTGDRDTRRREVGLHDDPVAAGVRIWTGGLTCLDAAGNATPGATALNLTARGRAEHRVDNTAGAAGDKRLKIRAGCFRFDNLGSDPCTRAHIGQDAFIVDDQTVAATDGTGTRSRAGRIADVDSGGVWVEIP